ncbi:uncharacterized protein KY384_005145 [Bacidia gigantensis]|uniref:uncharacterized protein n=1 Tax=Bacidia gigantensis TaxID=2732470 RepID=UPI001D03A725|nr:uncharacterized protein KY384_005145 [Bacidia gigantensis]KAG8529664.1 hypothetical protein KY384_005145 [Bacidia gigantensis]
MIPGHPFPPLIYAFALTYYASILLKPKIANAGQSVDNDIAAKHSSSKEAEREGSNTYWNIVRGGAFGLPSPSWKIWNTVILAVNAFLVLGTLDVVYRGPVLYPSHDLSFARVGHVSGTTAKILIREPDPSRFPLHVSYHAILSEPGLADPWKPGGTIHETTAHTDYTSVVEVAELEPATTYEYKLTNNHTGSFTTAPPLAARGNKVTFLTTSCIKPNFPYNPLSHPLHIPGLSHLSNVLDILARQSFMLFLGDFIYIDVPHRHDSDPSTYRAEYRRVYSSPFYQAVSYSLPWIHVIDDHEIANDWDQGLSAPYPAAIDPWMHYHHAANPPSVKSNRTYYTFRNGPATFFMLDTRRYRSPSTAAPATDAAKTMLGKEQLDDLLAWLARPEPVGVKFKVVVSSIPFTRNWRINAQDTWGGYLVERQKVLRAMWEVNINKQKQGNKVRVIVLSGDRHEFAATRFPPPPDFQGQGEEEGSKDVFEFSTSPLSMFYLPLRTYWEDKDGGGMDWQEWGRDNMVKYIPDGNSKVAAIEMEDIEETGQGLCRFRLFVDGKEAWSYEITSG